MTLRTNRWPTGMPLSDSACTTTRTCSDVIPSSCSLALKPQSNTFWITANQTSRGYAPSNRSHRRGGSLANHVHREIRADAGCDSPPVKHAWAPNQDQMRALRVPHAPRRAATLHEHAVARTPRCAGQR